MDKIELQFFESEYNKAHAEFRSNLDTLNSAIATARGLVGHIDEKTSQNLLNEPKNTIATILVGDLIEKLEVTPDSALKMRGYDIDSMVDELTRANQINRDLMFYNEDKTRFEPIENFETLIREQYTKYSETPDQHKIAAQAQKVHKEVIKLGEISGRGYDMTALHYATKGIVSHDYGNFCIRL